MANGRVVVDPVTRIEGHLRIEAEVENKTITKAYSSGTAVRGIELIVRGATRATSGHLPSASAACARPSTPLLLCGRSRTPSGFRSPTTPTSSAT